MPRYAVLFALPLLLVGLCGAGPVLNSGASVELVGSGETGATMCSRHARMAADGMMSPADAVQTCTDALQGEALSPHNAAATHVNRGVLYLTMSGYDAARADFDDAVQAEPALPESYINRGAALVAMGDNAAGVADLDRGISMEGLKEPWKAYFNLGIAHENLGDTKAAYENYMKALELKPDWTVVKSELARFSVKH